MKGTIQKTIKPLSRFAGALMLVASFLFTGCPNKVTVKPEMFAVTFSAGEHGTVGAAVDGKAITSGDVVQKDKTVVFTARPADGYAIEKWAVNGTTVANNTTASYSRKVTAKTDVKVFFKPSGDTRYTVKHFKEKVTGGYDGVQAEIETLTGTTGNNTAATAKTYTGFITPATVAQKPIAADGSTVIEIKYARKEITLTFNLAGGTINGKTDSVTVKGKYGEAVTKPDVPKKDGYTFSGWNPELPETFPAENATYTAQWAKLHLVTFTVKGTPPNGTLTATLDGKAIDTGAMVAEEKIVEFTAKDDDYAVENWIVTPKDALIKGGKPGESTAKVKITAATTVEVTFSYYKKVAFEKLDEYLKTANAASDGIYYIEVTGLTASDVKGESWSNPSPLSKILQGNASKKVALKLGAIAALTDMSYCFYDCTSLTQAPVIPSSVTNMNRCFFDCISLVQTPEIPNSVTNMDGCFSGCTSLTQAPVIPSSVTNMVGCFSGCTSLVQAPEIPNSVTSMNGCFQNCTSLTQAPVIPDKITDISACFSGCTSLTQAPEIPSSVTNMSYCFSGCTSLTQSPVIPSSVKYMSVCFSGCTSLTQAPVIPDKVTDMESCFSGCTKLTSVTLKCNYPSSTADADAFKNAFKNCSSLIANSIKVPADQLQTYKDNADMMRTTADRFIAE